MNLSVVCTFVGVCDGVSVFVGVCDGVSVGEAVILGVGVGVGAAGVGVGVGVTHSNETTTPLNIWVLVCADATKVAPDNGIGDTL